ncbi:MAG: prepilin peptidase, partial [Candidatus Acidiferrales bacterium]
MLPAAFIGGIVFLFGLVLGSFLNVCIIRIPAGKSIVLPASACPACNAPIRPYDNIPVLSFLILGGKCRQCKTRISPMYPLVEFLTGGLFLACYLAFGLTVETLKWCIFAALVVVLVFTDLRERILPDIVNYGGLGLGLALSLFTMPADGFALWLANRIFAYPPPA